MELTLRRPDDLHLHLRDGAVLRDTVAHTARQFARALVMPNLTPPVTTPAAAHAYHDRILAALPRGLRFQPLMSLYLTDNTRPEHIAEAAAGGVVHAVKYYPAGATTNSDSGVTDVRRTWPVMQALSETGMLLLLHGEVTDPECDVFDRERVFIERVLAPLLERFPDLRVVLEHITTADAVDFVRASGPRVAATITAHHLLLNRNALFKGGLRPHHYCLPVPKRERHREALVEAAVSGEPSFFLGTDSAPHTREAKESACGCAGVYTAHAAMEFYAEVFEQAGRLERLEAFASEYGARFYGLPLNTERVRLLKQPWTVPGSLPLADSTLVPLRAGEHCQWKLLPAATGSDTGAAQ